MIKKYYNIPIERQQKNILCEGVIPVYFNHDKNMLAGYASASYKDDALCADFVLNIIIKNPCELYPSVGIQKLDDGAYVLKEIGLCNTENLDQSIKPLIIKT